MKSKTLLVTGGAGFIGSHLVDRLLRDGNQVIVIDDFNDTYAPSIKRSNIAPHKQNKSLTVIEEDIRTLGIFDEIFSKYKVDSVVHLAARGGVRDSINAPDLYWDVNTLSSLNLLKAMTNHRVKHLVFASSSSVYGNRSQGPFKETDETDNPNSPYSASKKALELMTKTYANLYDIQTTGLRFFNVYGPRNRPNMACSNFAHAFLTNGEIIKYGDGSTGRDYTYIDDIVEGIVASINNPFDYEIINLGNSTPVTLNELIATFEDIFETSARINQQDLQPGDIQLTFADNTKAKKLLKWTPTTQLRDGLVNLVEWMKQTSVVKT